MSGAPQVIRRQRRKAKDRYIVEHLIGQGGMGAVYKARDVELERTVALKLLHPSLRNGDSEQRLKRELVLASRVSHRHVVRVYDFGEIRGTKFISMAFIDGENLQSLLAREGRLAVARAIHIAEELCEALRAAHTVGVVHRDLKPQNILLDGNGSAYISDFGLARSSIEPNGDITKAGEYPGSPAYMSPEQALGLPVDQRSDLYALGLVLYEMVAGKLPSSAIAPVLDHERFNCRIKSPAALNPEVPENLAQVILRCLEVEPSRRYQTASEILTALKNQPIEAGAEIPLKRRWRMKPVAGATILALLLGSLAFLILGTPRPPPNRIAGLPAGSHRHGNKLAIIPLRIIGDANSLRSVADSLTEAVSSRAAQSQRIRLFFDESGGSPAAAGRRLGADAVLAGSVASDGGDILATVHLTDCATGEATWTGQFRASPTNLLGLEDQIWTAVASVLKLDTPGTQATPALLHATKNLEAYKLYMQGSLLLRMRRNRPGAEQAMLLFRQASNLDMDYFYPYLGLADANLLIFKQTHDDSWLQKAKLAAGQAQSMSNNRPEAQIQVAKIQIANGQYPEAVRLLGSALELDPSSDEAYRALGRAQLLSGNAEQAIAAYRKAIEIDSHSWLNHNALGAACLRLGRTKDAEQAFRKAMELAPLIDDNYTNLGNAYLQSGRVREAVGFYEKAVALGPDAINYSNLGTALFYLGKYRASVPIFLKAVKLDSRSETLMGNLADAYRWSDQSGKATETYFRAVVLGCQYLDTNPRDADTRGRLAVYYAKMGDFENARASIRLARELDPGNSSLQYEEAVISTLAYNLPAAKLQLRAAIASGYPDSLAGRDPELRPLFQR